MAIPPIVPRVCRATQRSPAAGTHSCPGHRDVICRTRTPTARGADATAEVAAGVIAMSLGGYLATRTDTEHYVSREAGDIRRSRGRDGRSGEHLSLVRAAGDNSLEYRPGHSGRPPPLDRVHD